MMLVLLIENWLQCIANSGLSNWIYLFARSGLGNMIHLPRSFYKLLVLYIYTSVRLWMTGPASLPRALSRD